MLDIIPIRLTYNKQFTQQELKTFLNKHSNLVLILEYKNWETREGAHYHGWIPNSFNTETVRKWFQKELHCNGNSDYSFKVKKQFSHNSIEYYKYYCCKSTKDNPPFEYYNISQLDILQNWRLFWENRQTYIDLQKKKHQSIKQQLDDWISDRSMTFSNNPKTLIRSILTFYEANDLSISNNQVEEKYHYYRTKYEPEYLNIRTNLILEKLTRLNC